MHLLNRYAYFFRISGLGSMNCAQDGSGGNSWWGSPATYIATGRYGSAKELLSNRKARSTKRSAFWRLPNVRGNRASIFRSGTLCPPADTRWATRDRDVSTWFNPIKINRTTYPLAWASLKNILLLPAASEKTVSMQKERFSETYSCRFCSASRAVS